MAPTQKRKADDGPLSLNTKRARKKVVKNELAEKVDAIQLLDSRHEFSSNCLHSHQIFFVYYVRRILTSTMVSLWTWLVLVLKGKRRNLPFWNVSANRTKIDLNLLVG
jgi:hypothetical protein